MAKLRKTGRTRAAVVGAVLAAAAFASLAATGYAARLVPFSHASPTADQYPAGKVTICHHTHSAKNPFVTITVSVHALPAHLKHGDTIGPCSQAPPAATVVGAAKVHKVHKQKHATKSKLHGHGKSSKSEPAAKSHGKGKSNDKSKNDGAQGHGQAPTRPSTVHGKGHEKTNGQAKTHGSDKAHGQGKNHVKTHGNAGGQGHGNGQGETHGNSSGNGNGNGKGKGH